MSFTPISGGLSTALSGSVEPVKFLDVNDLDTGVDVRSDVSPGELYFRRMHGSANINQTTQYTIILIIVSAIIFVTVVSLYDIIRTGMNTYFANRALTDPNSHDTAEDIERTMIANMNALWSSIAFAFIALALAVIFLLPLMKLLGRYSERITL